MGPPALSIIIGFVRRSAADRGLVVLPMAAVDRTVAAFGDPAQQVALGTDGDTSLSSQHQPFAKENQP